jgi:hypothetical protein
MRAARMSWMVLSVMVAIGGCASPGNQTSFMPPMPGGATAVPAPAPYVAPAPAPAADGGAIPGRYAAMLEGQRAEIVLAADGTAVIGGLQGRWAYQAGALLLDDGQQQVQAEHDGNAIILRGPKGSLAFQREGTAPSPPPAPAPNLDQGLIGCWDSHSGSSGGTGSHSSQHTIGFAPDGRFAGRSFATIYIPNGASTSDVQKEEGTWSATGSVLSLRISDGSSRQHQYLVEGGILYMNDRKYVPISCN